MLLFTAEVEGLYFIRVVIVVTSVTAIMVGCSLFT